MDLIARAEHHSDWHAFITCPKRGELGYCLEHGGDEIDLATGEYCGEPFDPELATRVLARDGWSVVTPWRETDPDEDAEHQWAATVRSTHDRT